MKTYRFTMHDGTIRLVRTMESLAWELHQHSNCGGNGAVEMVEEI